MTARQFDHPPRLAVGTHSTSKTFLCAMNIVSFVQGEKVISDTPSCTPRPLALMVQSVNDKYCTHLVREEDPDTGCTVSALCPPCSVKVLRLALRTVNLPQLTFQQGWQWVAHLLRDEDVYSARAENVRAARRVALEHALNRPAVCDPYPLTGTRPLLVHSVLATVAHATKRNDLVTTTFPFTAHIAGLYEFNSYTQQRHRDVIEGAGVQYVEDVGGRHLLKLQRAEAAMTAAHRAIDEWVALTAGSAKAADVKDLATA
jgi:hypothetical protein